MRYQQIRDRSESDFKRLTGVRVGVFRPMLPTLFSPTNRGRPAKLSCSDQLRMTLMYWREYRTQYHMAQAYAVSQSTVGRTIQRVENRLIQGRQFRRPSKRELLLLIQNGIYTYDSYIRLVNSIRILYGSMYDADFKSEKSISHDKTVVKDSN